MFHRVSGFLLISSALFAQSVDSAMTAKIRAEGSGANSQAASIFDTLTVEIGPRLTNSPAFFRTVDFVADKLKSFGFENARKEPWKFGRGWTLDKFTLELVEPRYAPLIGYATAWSPSTTGDLVATPVYLGNKTLEQADAMKASFKGAIVMPVPPQKVYVREDRPQPTSPGIAPPEVLSASPLFATPAATQKMIALVQAGSPGVVLRPNVLEDGTVYVTGRDAGAATAPSIVLASEHYNMIAGMIERGLPVKLRVGIVSTYQEQELNSYNVIAEIPGSDPAMAGQAVMLGAHMDSWHTGVGASDNADGVATMMEAMRILKAIGAKPKRTIRVALWGGEEQGLLGSKAWLNDHKAELDKLSVYFNIDNGTGPVYGFAMENNEGAKPLFDAWLKQFADMGARRNVNLKLTNTDHQAFIAAGVPGFNPFQDYEKYDVRTHHTNMDLRDHVNPEDIKQAAMVMASFAWQAATLDKRLPRK